MNQAFTRQDLDSSDRVSKTISLEGVDKVKLFGFHDRNLKYIQDRFDAKIVARGDSVLVEGASEVVDRVQKMFHELILMLKRDQEITEGDLETVCELVQNRSATERRQSEAHDPVIVYTKDTAIKPKTPGQRVFFDTAQKNDIVFVIGPAGTGKTFLAVAMAVAALRDRQVDRIILTRPAVEAGESLGFLPGDYREKVDPYLRPLYDALYTMFPADKLKRYVETRVLEIVPLAYMRGRTLNNAFVILDEAQNTTFNQMKMLLTRLGVNSRAIITGDITQIDLHKANESGLVQVRGILDQIEGIAFVYLSERDVVRHRLVRDIIRAYDNFENVSNKSQD